MQVEGGDGDNVSLITKSPSWSRATPVELVEEPGPQLVIVLLQKSWAWTTWPPFDPITFVLVSSKPIPLTQMCPTSVHIRLKFPDRPRTAPGFHTAYDVGAGFRVDSYTSPKED